VLYVPAMRLGGLAVLLLAGWAAIATPAAAAPTRYSLAGGCYALGSASTGKVVANGDRLRMQATRLGSYLLYGPAKDFLAAGEAGAVGPAAQPSPAAD
jgi:hypothetical protein